MKTNNIFKSLLVTVAMVVGAADMQAQNWNINFVGLTNNKDYTVAISSPVITIDNVGFGTVTWGEDVLKGGELVFNRATNPSWDKFDVEAGGFFDAGLKDGASIQFIGKKSSDSWGLDIQNKSYQTFTYTQWKGDTGSKAKLEITNNHTSAYSVDGDWVYINIYLTSEDITSLRNSGGMYLGCWGFSQLGARVYYSGKEHDIDSKFVLQTGTNWMLRPSNKYGGGLYSMNDTGCAFGLLNCKKGDIITIVTRMGSNDLKRGENTNPNVIANATLQSSNETGNSSDNTYVYKVNSNGAVRFNPTRYIMLRSISIKASTDPTEQQEYVTATVSSSTGYATFCSTEPLNFTSVDETLKAYVATSTTYDAVVLEQVTGDIAAGVGLIISGSTTEVPVAGTSGKTPQGNLLVGVTSGTETIQGSNKYVLTDESGKAKFAVTTNRAAYIPAGHAYLQVSNNARTRSALSIGGENDGTTGINTFAEETANDGAIYNLSGQRVKMPTKGIYIINGKKVIVK